jgi:hypothetical protein
MTFDPDAYDRVYSYGGRVAHLRPVSRPMGANYATACGVFPSLWGAVLGTGNQTEYDRAAALPTCKRCAKASGAPR